jgi:hypothetical protein
MGERDLVLPFDILVSTWWWSTQKRAETCSCFLQQLENTVVLRRTFIHLISTGVYHYSLSNIPEERNSKIVQLWCNEVVMLLQPFALLLLILQTLDLFLLFSRYLLMTRCVSGGLIRLWSMPSTSWQSTALVRAILLYKTF